MKYDAIIPIGANCRVAQALRDLNLRQEAYPLDWTLSSAQSVFELFQHNFSRFFDESACQNMISKSQKGKDYPWVLNSHYQIGFMHEASWSGARKATYAKRFEALTRQLNSNSALLIRWDMKAPYHNDPTHVVHEERDKDHFKQADSLDSCYQLKDFCNEHYKANVDLLVLHCDEIPEAEKRSDVFYHLIDFATAQHLGKAKEWDRTAIKHALTSLNLALTTPMAKPASFLQRFITKVKRNFTGK